MYLLSEDTIHLLFFWCIKILHLNFRESLFYYFFLFLFLANSKKDQIMKYCYGLHCPHLLQPRGQLSGACASELLQYFKNIYTHTDILTGKTLPYFAS